MTIILTIIGTALLAGAILWVGGWIQEQVNQDEKGKR